MQVTRQLDSVWQRAREDSRDGDVLRRRVAAIGALSLGVGGFLIAIGLTVVVLGFLAASVVAAGIVAFLAAWPALRAFGLARLASVRERSRAAHGRIVPGWRSKQRAARAALIAGRARSATRARTTSQTLRGATTRLAQLALRREPAREALRLNALGTQHRREGRYDDAVECHRQALEMLRSVDDRRGVALTKSNLALALSHAGDDGWAIGLLEEAAATLHDLGDEEYEARIMANLGAAHRRHGRPKEGADVLELALSKLSPASSAYEAIEAELKRAS